MARLPRETLREFQSRANRPGLIRLAVQTTWFAASLAATSLLALQGSVLQWVAVGSAGLALATFFPPLHEAGHKTAFATQWLNSVTVWVCAVLMLQAPSFFREFHWAHHRDTQDPETDPEIAAAPGLLDGYPSNPLLWFVLASGQLLLVGKLMFTVQCALLPRGTWDRVFPFLPEKRRARIAWESRLVLAILGGIVWLGFEAVPGFATMLWAWPVAHVALGLYLMPEHTGLPHDGTQTHRTRTIETVGAVRWLMWNMPYHTAHHEYPSVPFHRVPDLNAAMASDLEHVSTGYLAFHREALRHAFGRGGQ